MILAYSTALRQSIGKLDFSDRQLERFSPNELVEWLSPANQVAHWGGDIYFGRSVTSAERLAAPAYR